MNRIYIIILTALSCLGANAEVADSIYRDLSLEQLVVTGTLTPKSLKDTPIQTRVISHSDIEKSDATNVQELLQQELPGVEFSYAMNQLTHLNFSGFGGQSVLFLVDGERLAGETMDDVDFSRLTMTSVERIEIIKGAASALYGSNAAGGVINIITKAPGKPFSANVNGRTAFHSHREESRYGAAFSVGGSKWWNSADFTATKTDSYDFRNGPHPATNNYAHRFYGDRTYNVTDRLTWQPHHRLRLTGRGGFFFREKDTQTAMEPDRYRDVTLGARALWEFSSSDRLETSYAFDQYDKAKYYTVSGLELRYYSNVQHSAKATYCHTFDSGILTIGGDYMRDYLLNEKTADGRYTQHTADVFAQYDWNIMEQLEIVTALRYDYLSDGNNHRISPKFNIRYTPSRDLTLRAGYGMGFRTPTLKEKYYIWDMVGIWDIVGGNIVGNDLRPEISHNFNISAEYIRGGYVATLSAYANSISNRITTGAPRLASEFTGDIESLSTMRWLPYINVKHCNTYGIDVTLRKQWNNGIGARLSYSYVREERAKDADGKSISNQYLPARPHSLTAFIDWDHQVSPHYGVNISLNGRFLSAVDNIEFVDYITIDPATGQLLRKDVHYKAYTLWKLMLTQRFYDRVKMTLTIDNILDYKPEYHYFNAPFTDGTKVLLGLSVDF